ncbi:MAG: hypothetical protein IJ047_06595 [Paludibacteraceae bacterium]|nr:hypothetical protein [Paludibacteraceae bacterium]
MRVKEYILALGLLLLGMTACSPTEPDAKKYDDPRDAFVGEYDYTSIGDMDIYIAGKKVYSTPFDKDGSFEIVKETEASKVAIVGIIYGDQDSIHAIVNGNQLTLQNNSANYSNDLGTIKMMISYEPATLTGNKLVWEADVIGMGTFQSYSITAEGHISMEATKK